MAANRDSINTTVFEEKGRAALAGLGWGGGRSTPAPTVYSFLPVSLEHRRRQRLGV